MRRSNVVGLVGVEFLVAGIIFGIFNPKLFDHWYDWIFGPLFWLIGCALMIAWSVQRIQTLDRRSLEQRRKSTAFGQSAETSPGRMQEHVPERRHEERRKSQSVA